ncbi:MAG TPA: hypothetical protein VMS00_14535, partial [Acidimicrobiales bacterium]|nr:hypothetical protein [Acidimicrobiales bacterium]
MGKFLKVALAVLSALALALPTRVNAAAALAPAHVLEVRWTAAALWYEAGTNAGNNFPGEGNNKTFSIGGRVGVDIVWREKIRPNQDQPPTEYGFTPTVLYSFARVVNQTDVPGVSCEGSFSPALTHVYGTSEKVPLISGGATEGFTYTLEPINIFQWLPTAPAGTICARPPGELDGYGCSNCSTAFSPDLPVPPYSPSDNEATLREIGARLIVNWKDPNQAKSYTWQQVGHWSTPEPGGASAATNHSLWFGCVSVQEDPPANLPPPVDPFTLGGYRVGGVLQDPGALPLNPCSSHPSAGPPLTTTSAPTPSCQKPGTAKDVIQTAVRDDMNAELQVLVRRTDLSVGSYDVNGGLPAAAKGYEDAMLDDFDEHAGLCMAVYLATWKFRGGVGGTGKSPQLVQAEVSPPLATLFQLEQTFQK